MTIKDRQQVCVAFLICCSFWTRDKARQSFAPFAPCKN